LNKTPLLLITLILVPALILSWYSIRLEKQQQLLFGHQLTSLIETQLEDIRAQLQGHFLRMEDALKETANEQYRFKTQLYSTQKLRALVQSSPYIDQVFVINPQGKTVYPVFENSSVQENLFLETFKPLLDRHDLFQVRKELPDKQPSPSASPSAPLNEVVSAQLKSAPAVPKLEISARTAPRKSSSYESLSSAASDSVTASQPDTQSGWIAWYLGAELQHIFWMEDTDQDIFGFKLNGSRLLSDLLNQLPDQSSAQMHNALSHSAIRLVNSLGNIFYEWGELTQIDEQTQPLKVVPLYHPLGSWQLEFYSPSLLAPKNNWFEKAAILVLVILGLATVAWLLYREQTRAARLAEQRVNFVNQVSHELKTPLTNVRMYAEMLEHRVDESDSAQIRYIGVINNESQRLSRLIDNVLSFSKLSRNTDTITPELGYISETVETVIENFTPAFNQKGLSITFTNQAKTQVYFDRAAIEQILNNLMGNCEKYATQSGTVTISCWENSESKQVCIRVKDSGPGIPETAREAIFQPFYRVSNKLTDGVTGTGIGLSIARELARAHGGELVLEGSSVGASFLLTLPLLGEKR